LILNKILDTELHKNALIIVGILIILVLFGQRLWLLQSRFFDNDEFEHMHSAWLISNGQMPYLDYFEHHTPAMHFMIAPFFSFFEVETEPDQAVNMLVFSRKMMWVLSGVILLLTFWLGKTWRGWRFGLLGTVFLICTVMFQEKSLEIRPDLLSLPCWIGCLILLLKSIQHNSLSIRQQRWLIAGCGFLLGTSIMATQKMLFAMPGFTLAMFVFWFSPGSAGNFQERFIMVLCQLGGFFLPMLLMLGYFQLHHSNGAYAFIEYNLLLNLGWKAGFSPKEYIDQLLEQNPFLVGFGLIGMLLIAYRAIKKPNFERADYVMVINLIGLLVGLFIIPVPWRQYYLIFIPLLGLFAASFIVDTIDDFLALMGDRTNRKELLVKGALFLVLLVILVIFTLSDYRPIAFSVIVKKVILFIAILSFVIPLYLQKRDLTILVLLVMVHLPVVKKFKNRYKIDNSDQLSSISYVIDNSPADSTFMDGWKGIGVFRQHAYFYWMLHPEVRGMLSQEQIDQLLIDLQTGAISPYFVNLDEDLEDLSPEITRFIRANFEPVGVADLHRRK